MTEWRLYVDEQTDQMVRAQMAEQGLAEEDLSSFVTQKLREAMFWQAVDTLREHNRDVDPDVIQAEVDQALDEVRAARP